MPTPADRSPTRLAGLIFGLVGASVLIMLIILAWGFIELILWITSK